MKAAVLREVGSPLAVEEAPDPEAGAGQSVVDVKAAGINYADVLIKNGHYPQPPELPTILGNEIAGDIGDRRVIAFVRHSGGAYAERVAVDDEWVFDLPAGASYAEGAAFLTTYLTAWIPMTRQARIHPDTNVLVTAAAGGVGTAAVQVAAFEVRYGQHPYQPIYTGPSFITKANVDRIAELYKNTGIPLFQGGYPQ